MKYFIVLLSIFISTLTFAQKQKEGVVYEVTITRVLDGDTVAFQANWLPAPLKKELAIRVFGVDTPEKNHRAKCPQEDRLGQAATQFTTQAIQQSTRRQIILMSWDKYGGRVLGDVILDGKSLRMMLIENGYAREYYGEAKTSWC